MITYLLLLILLIIIYIDLYHDNGVPECKIHKSEYGDEYCITDSNTNTANILSRLNSDIVYLLYCLKYGGGNYSTAQQKIIKRVLENYNPDNIVENPPYGKDTSFTIGKGKVLALCVRSDNKSRPVEYNTILYVCLHELSHLGVNETGHDEEFNEAFDFILSEAIKYGIYKYVDYSKTPAYYCNMVIDS